MNVTNAPTEPSSEKKAAKSLQWNLGGWYIASVGAVLWMIATPFLLSWPTSGVVAGIVGTLVIWSFSSLTWGLRKKIPAFQAIIGLLVTTIISNAGFLLFAQVNKLPLDGAADAIEGDYGLYYGLLLTLIVFAMILFWLKEGRATDTN